MNSWSRNRKRIIFSIVLLGIIVLIGIPVFFFFYQRPTCFDKKQNGDETGVDCGGSCELLCSAESLPIIMKGDPRVITVATSTATSTYEVVALLDNPNPEAEIYRAHYTFKIFDSVSTIPLKTIEGDTFVPKGGKFAVFAGPFNLSSGLNPTHATIEWDKSTLIWQKNSSPEPEIVIGDKLLSKEESAPRLDATVENRSLETASNIDLIALIFDQNGNLFAASKTYIEKLDPGEAQPIIFTWPRPFSTKAAQVDIYTRLFPDSSFLH